MASIRLGSLPRSIAIVGGALALMTLSIGAGQLKVAEFLAAGVAGYGLARVFVVVLAEWSWLIYALAAVDLLIPEDSRYLVHGVSSVGFQFQPYRVLVTVMIAGWFAALMVDPRVRPRKTKFEGPLILIWIAIIGSDLFNAGAVSAVSSAVLKQLTLTLSLLLMLYIFVSVVRTRATLERTLRVFVAAGCVVALGAMIERATKYNLFNHLHRFLPLFAFDSSAEPASLLRGGHFRAIASAGHPIELSNDMAMLTPIAAYLAIRGSKMWWGALSLLILGDLSAGSRTGIVGLLVVAGVFLWMRPRQTLRCWPALIPILVVVQVAMPGAVRGTIDAFFPKGGLIAQQSATFAAHGQVQDASRLSRIGPQLRNTFAKHNEFFGKGYGTRIVGRTSVNAPVPTLISDQILDDQWLGNLLDTGLVGFAAWIWLFWRVVRKLRARARAERATDEGWLPAALAASIMCYAVSMYFYDAFGFIQATVMMYVLLGCASVLLWLPPTQRRATDGMIMPPLKLVRFQGRLKSGFQGRLKAVVIGERPPDNAPQAS